MPPHMKSKLKTRKKVKPHHHHHHRRRFRITRSKHLSGGATPPTDLANFDAAKTHPASIILLPQK
jgi:hypothetical protein